jgi:glycine oxidase
VLEALRVACESAGVALREHARVERVGADTSGRVTSVVLADGQSLAAERVVVAAGAWSPQIAGAGERPVPVRPVRGQLLRLRDPSGPGMLSRVIRFERGYVVPRADGRYVLGATVEERGFDVEPSVGGVYELLRDAHELVPGISELKIEELCVGLRPGMPDNAPAIGPASSPLGLTWATGHHRNGILLAPLTAELVSKMLAGERLDATERALLDSCDPRRFTTGSVGESSSAQAVARSERAAREVPA